MSQDHSYSDADVDRQQVLDDDAFLDQLSQGLEPAEGADELGALFLELRDDVEKPMPPAPIIDPVEEQAEVVSLDKRRRQGFPQAILSGLIGAAAATVLIAGSGIAVFNAGPGSPLYSANQAVFGSDVAVVDLAGKLEEMEVSVASGDMEGIRQLLRDARRMADELRNDDPDKPEEAQAPARPARPESDVTTTVTTTRGPEPRPIPEPRKTPDERPAPDKRPSATATTTVVERVTETVVRTVTERAPEEAAPRPSQPQNNPPAEPEPDPNAPRPDAGAGETGEAS